MKHGVSEMVLEFHKTFGLPIRQTPRIWSYAPERLHSWVGQGEKIVQDELDENEC